MNEDYVNDIKELIAHKESDQLKARIADLHPADIAELCNELSLPEARSIYLLLDLHYTTWQCTSVNFFSQTDR